MYANQLIVKEIFVEGNLKPQTFLVIFRNNVSLNVFVAYRNHLTLSNMDLVFPKKFTEYNHGGWNITIKKLVQSSEVDPSYLIYAEPIAAKNS